MIAAEDHADVTVGAGAQQIGKHAEGSVSASAQARDVEYTNDLVSTFATSSCSLRRDAWRSYVAR